jgi:hypothetical protein
MPDDVAAILELEARRSRALVDGDVAALDEITAGSNWREVCSTSLPNTEKRERSRANLRCRAKPEPTRVSPEPRALRT